MTRDAGVSYSPAELEPAEMKHNANCVLIGRHRGTVRSEILVVGCACA